MKGIFDMMAALIRGLFTQIITPMEISRRAQMIRSRRKSCISRAFRVTL